MMNTIELPQPDNICSVIVTYNPTDHVSSLVAAMQDQTDHIILVDNHSKDESRQMLTSLLSDCVEWIPNDKNRGIAAALNQGVQAARTLGYRWALTIDQDSTPDASMVQAFCTAFRQLPRPERVAVMGPRLFDVQAERWSTFLVKGLGPFYRRIHCTDTSFMPVTSVITSGSLFNIHVVEELGWFREDFFIDYVDTEFCLRASKRGYAVLLVCGAVLHHRLGNRRKAKIGALQFFPTFHSPQRWYYIARNRIPMVKLYARHFPHWFTYELAASTYNLLRMLLTEDQRVSKLHAIWRGTRDGLRGKMGPINATAI